MRDFAFTFEPEIVKAKTSDKKGDLVIWAYASTYDVDSDDCQITKEALEGAKNDLLEYNTVLFNHNMDRPIGYVMETKIDNKGLLVKIILSQSERELMQKIQDGTLSKLSISGRAYDFKETAPDDKGRTILQITNIKLFEVSIVSVPANKEAKTVSSAIVKQLFLSKMVDENTSKSLLADLQILAGKSSGDTKEILDRVLEFFKTTEQQNMKKTKDENEYTFSDESINRPVFQLTLSDLNDGSVELSDDNTFRKQLLKKGRWYHWGADNGVLNITEKKIDELVSNFKKSIIESVPVPLTHSSDPSMNTGQVTKLIKTTDGLDAIIQIKDDTIASKIKKGLITAISASFDPNYMIKKTKKYVGPVLLHAALVSEPYIKGMNKFIALDDEFDGRQVIALEDSKQNIELQLTAVLELLKKIQSTVVQKNEDDINKEEDAKEEDATNEDVKEKEDAKEEDVEKAKKGDDCKTEDGEKGTMQENKDGKLVCVPIKKTKKEIEEKSSTEDASDETDVDNTTDETKEDESDEAATNEKVDLVDSEKMYDEYLKSGKIVPAQKDTFIALCESMKTIQLTDNSVDVSDALNNFMQSQPKVVNFSEDGTVEDKTEEKPDITKDEMPTDVKDFYMEKMNLSEEQAQEAYKVAQATHGETAQQSTIFD